MVNGALALPNPVTVLLYRIYIPASGLPLNADVPLPALTLETAAGDVLVPSRAGCSEPVLGTVVNQLAQVDINGALLRVDYPDQLSFVPLRFPRSEEHTSELQSLMRISYAVFCLKKKKTLLQQH